MSFVTQGYVLSEHIFVHISLITIIAFQEKKNMWKTSLNYFNNYLNM